jgi:2-C-methyl-D-erythritol 4-phosphate cytidylyltransferase
LDGSNYRIRPFIKLPLSNWQTGNEGPMTTSSARLFALVPCAGVGQRAGTAGPKQYEALLDAPVVGHTLHALAGVQRISHTLVVLHPQDARFESELPHFQGWLARCGGDTRAQTVLNGLAVLRDRGALDDDWVLVHDAARCLVRPAWINTLIDACWSDAVGGLLALPLADTLKAEQAGRSISTLDRGHKWLAQTPQMFRLKMLEQALQQAGSDVTDEASALEALGQQPMLVACSFENFKLTYPADFELAERLLRTRS